MGARSKASSLFDPRIEVLKDIFGDEPDAFPTGEFAKEGWLDLLVDVGLRNAVNSETILLCAKKVSCPWDVPFSFYFCSLLHCRGKRAKYVSMARFCACVIASGGSLVSILVSVYTCVGVPYNQCQLLRTCCCR